MMAGGMAIALDGISLAHGGAAALADVSCTIAPGQFCAILGRSGAGKSSLLRIVGGMAMPSGGRLRLDGRDEPFPRRRAISRSIGQVHQDYALVPQASAAHNIIAGAAAGLAAWRILAGLYPRWARERAVALHLALGLEGGQLAMPVRSLSGGQQQRVGVARALMLEPRLVLADEPVANVDHATARVVMGHLAAYRARTGATVLCALHQSALACQFADRVLVLEAGRLVFDGTPDAYRGALAPPEAA